MAGLVDSWRKETVRLVGAMLGDRATRGFALVLGAVALLLVGMHVFSRLSVWTGAADGWLVHPKHFLLHRDHSVSEVYEYLLTLVGALLVATVWRSTRQPIYLTVSAVFTFMVLDNALMLHERAASALVRLDWLPWPTTAEHAQATGELGVLVVAGAGLAAFAALGFWRSGFRHRVAATVLLAPVGLAVMFGVGVDFFKAFIDGPWWLGYTLTIVEDGGELLAIVLLLVVAYGTMRTLPVPRHALQAGRPSPALAGAAALASNGRPVRTGPGRR